MTVCLHVSARDPFCKFNRVLTQYFQFMQTQVSNHIISESRTANDHAIDPALPPHCAQIGSPTLPEPGSSAQFAFMKEWLRVCQETHNHGNPSMLLSNGVAGDATAKISSTELPTRVVDVGSLDRPMLQLVSCEAMTSHEYIALSHCWGQGSMFRAIKDNFDTLQRKIDFHLLPRSFQDAITVTRALKMRYLWIDSLCIIQDDERDWENEAARMQQVFSNATCVIAASAASSSAAGFLEIPRLPRTWVTLRTPAGVTLQVTKFVDNFHRDVEEAILNKRGWVLQERALARRSIHFTDTQLYMECGRGIHCESLMKLTKFVFLNTQAWLLG